MPRHFDGLSWSLLDPACQETIENFENGEFGENPSLFEQPLLKFNLST